MTAAELARELELLVRSRYPILYLVTHEERRTEKLVQDVASKLGKRLLVWTSTQGLTTPGGPPDASREPAEALARVGEAADRAIFVFQDLHAFFDDARVVRRLRDLARDLRHTFKTLVLMSPVLRLPPELEKDVSVLDVPLPDQPELDEILEGVIAGVRGDTRVRIELTPELRERMLQAALGLTAVEAESIFCKAVVEGLKLDEDDLDLILAEKKQIIRKGGLLEFYELDQRLGNVGGLAKLKGWLDGRKASFTARARTFGLPEPKGLLLLGVQGCGKSLTAKAIASHWKLPLLRMDVGNVFSSLMGASEENMRKSIKTAESLAPCVLWLDELEKGFAGAGGSGDMDSGTTRRVFATFLTWIQEKTRPVFVVATANSIENLPPELLRKGRFDEIFFLDLPDPGARREILSIHLERRKRDPRKFDLAALVDASAGMSGAEIEELVVSGLYRAFAESERELATADIQAAARETVPLSVTMREPIERLRTWARDRARPAE